jgi:N-acetylglucosaminyl-diphospho-decaprenol L-rhamnosyltransferase
LTASKGKEGGGHTIGVVIVTWNSEAEIGPCLQALQRWHDGDVLVVDNASKDHTCQMVQRFPNARLLAETENHGFAGGVNRGVAAVSGDYILILNPDTELQGPLEPMRIAARQGAAGGRMLGEDGQAQIGFNVRRLPTPMSLCFEVMGLNRLFPGNPVNRRYRVLDLDLRVEQEVEQPPGAFFMVRREAFEQLGGMDERFWPVWFEDVDFCARLRQSGFKIRYTPAVSVKHLGGRSVNKIYKPFKQLAWYASLLRYATQQFGWCSRRMVGIAVVAASIPRAIAGIFYRHQNPHGIGVYARVIRLALKCLVLGRVEFNRSGRQEGLDH